MLYILQSVHMFVPSGGYLSVVIISIINEPIVLNFELLRLSTLEESLTIKVLKLKIPLKQESQQHIKWRI